MSETEIMTVQELILKPVKELIPYVNNSREHSDFQINQVAGSIKNFGFVIPILIDKTGMIIAGHCRVEAAHRLKMKSVPCVMADHMTPLQVKAYVIADNKLAQNSTWNDDILSLELQMLEDAGIDLHILGFNDAEIDEINNKIELPDESPTAQEYNTVFEVVIECDSEATQESLYNRFQEQGLKCRILSM